MAFPDLPDFAVDLHTHPIDWRAAVRLAGSALTRAGITSAPYADRMIGVIEEFGAHVVIAPGLALAHARPGPDVRGDGVAVVTIDEPVSFGHPYNDPVRVVLGLAVQHPDTQVAMVAEVANVFNEVGVVERLAHVSSADAVREILGASAGEHQVRR